MAFKVFAAGEVLTAADVNDYLAEQAVIVCTSGTRPSSPNEGMTIYETDTNLTRQYTGSAWGILFINGPTSYVPVLTASSSNPTLGTGNVAVGKYTYLPGGMIKYRFYVQFGTASVATGSGTYQISLPLTAADALAGASVEDCGSGIVRDSSGATQRQATLVILSSTLDKLIMYADDVPVTAVAPWTWAASDYLTGSIVYQAATS